MRNRSLIVIFGAGCLDLEKDNKGQIEKIEYANFAAIELIIKLICYYTAPGWSILENNSIVFLNLMKTFNAMRIVLKMYAAKLTS